MRKKEEEEMAIFNDLISGSSGKSKNKHVQSDTDSDDDPLQDEFNTEW
jgi:hypothetical protein